MKDEAVAISTLTIAGALAATMLIANVMANARHIRPPVVRDRAHHHGGNRQMASAVARQRRVAHRSPIPVAIPSSWRLIESRAMLLLDVRFVVQTDL
jgi:hypothetical protein